jgi:uncharacterized membrane protein YfcA
MEPEFVGLLLVANCLACFLEGGLGFGGSLVFIGLTMPVFGWTTSVLADAILASVNLSVTSVLYRRELDLAHVAGRGWCWAVVPLLAGALTFHLLPSPLRVVPLLAAGVVLLWSLKPAARRLFPALAGLGIGLGNTGAPFSFLYFQAHGQRSGNTALFTAGLMLVKVALLVWLWGVAELPGWHWLAALAVTGLPATWLGKRVLSRWPHRRRLMLVRIGVSVLLVILVVGGLHAD